MLTKTEILSNTSGIKFTIRYNGTNHFISSTDKIKINGIIFNMNETLQFEDNWNNGLKRMEEQLVRWQARSITTLGKIELYKTFGIVYIKSNL